MRKSPLKKLEDVKQLKFAWHIDFPIVEDDIYVKEKEVQNNTVQVSYLKCDLVDDCESDIISIIKEEN